jgi:hypothetical protein
VPRNPLTLSSSQPTTGGAHHRSAVCQCRHFTMNSLGPTTKGRCFASPSLREVHWSSKNPASYFWWPSSSDSSAKRCRTGEFRCRTSPRLTELFPSPSSCPAAPPWTIGAIAIGLALPGTPSHRWFPRRRSRPRRGDCPRRALASCTGRLDRLGRVAGPYGLAACYSCGLPVRMR